MKTDCNSLFTLLVMLPITCFAVLGCGSTETTIPDEAANVETPTDDPAEEPDMSEGP